MRTIIESHGGEIVVDGYHNAVTPVGPPSGIEELHDADLCAHE